MTKTKQTQILWKREKHKKYWKNGSLQASNMVVGVTCNMKPSTRINQCWVPALQNIVGIRKPGPQSMKSIPYTTNQPTKTKDFNTRNKKHSWLDFTRTYNWKAKGKVERWTCRTYLQSWLRWFVGETGEKGEIGQRGKLKVPFFLACEKILVCIKEEGKNLEWVKD